MSFRYEELAKKVIEKVGREGDGATAYIRELLNAVYNAGVLDASLPTWGEDKEDGFMEVTVVKPPKSH